jgi:hypothetical protein
VNLIPGSAPAHGLIPRTVSQLLSYRIPYKNETLGHIRVGAPAEEPCGHKQALRGVTSHLVTDMCMYSHANVGVSPRNCGKVMV